jgi:hypothetical protein
MKLWVWNAFAFTTGAVVAALALEGLLRLLPVPMGLYRTEQYQRWPLVNYEPNRVYTSSMSWEMQHQRRGSTNNYGHLAPFDYVPGSRPVIVVGDSFVDSQMNSYEDTLQGQLGNLLGRRETVYGLGANGLSISDYLAVSSLAAAEFLPRGAVILLTDGDVSESLSSKIGHYSFVVQAGRVELQYRPLHGETMGKRVRRLFGDSALYRYIQLNLHFDPMRIFERAIHIPSGQSAVATPRPRPPQTSEREVIDHFLGNLSSALKLPPSCVALLFHSDTYALADPAAATVPKDSPQLVGYFKERADAMGYRVVELKERFRSDYALHKKRLDYWPLDRHLNGRGHAIAAKAAFDALFYAGGAYSAGQTTAEPTRQGSGKPICSDSP